MKEIKFLELLQTKALDGVRIHREFSDTVLSKPNRNDMIKLNQDQKRKIEEILSRSS